MVHCCISLLKSYHIALTWRKLNNNWVNTWAHWALTWPKSQNSPLELMLWNNWRHWWMPWSQHTIISSLLDYQTVWWIRTGKEGLRFNLRLCPLVGTPPRHLLKTLLRLRKNLNPLKQNRNPQGSPDLNTDRGRTLNQKMMTFHGFDDTEFHKVLMELFNIPETETGEMRSSDFWIHTPAAWIQFHHVPRRTLYVSDGTEVTWSTWILSTDLVLQD